MVVQRWKKCYFFVFVTLTTMVVDTKANGRMIEPPSRSSLWRFKHTDPALALFQNVVQSNYNDMNLNCGGRKALIKNQGKCGVCGDSYSAAQKDNEEGGKYALGIITRRYKAGQVIFVQVEILADRKGYFEFSLCPRDSINEKITQKCFKRYPLLFRNGLGKWYLPADIKQVYGIHQFELKLPDVTTCKKCVLRWHYRAGNSWGSENGRQGLGLGQQAEFYGCADVAIERSSTNASAQKNVIETSTNSNPSPNLKAFGNASFKLSSETFKQRRNVTGIKVEYLLDSERNYGSETPDRRKTQQISKFNLSTVVESTRPYHFKSLESTLQIPKGYSSGKKSTRKQKRQRVKKIRSKTSTYSRNKAYRIQTSAESDASSIYSFFSNFIAFSLVLSMFLIV